MSAPERAPVQCSASWFPTRLRNAASRGPGTISWSEHLEAYAAYAERYGKSQSAERIANRGGFSIDELRRLLGREPASWRAYPEAANRLPR